MSDNSRPIAVVEPDRGPLTTLDVIQRAIVGGVNPDMLDKLIQMKERAEERAAAAAFAEAMQRFQAECPAIEKTTKAEKGRAGTQKYASLENMEEVVYDVANRCGLVISFTTDETGPADRLTVICRVRHGLHHEDTRVSIPITPIQGANATQSYAGAATSAQRLALRLALSLRIKSEGQAAPETLTAAEALEIQDLVQERVVDSARLLEFTQADRISLIPRSKFSQLRDMLLRKPMRGGQQK